MPATPDPLLDQLNTHIASQPRGAIAAMAKVLHLHQTCITTWRKQGSIPEQHRELVRGWIAETTTTAEHQPTAAIQKRPRALKRNQAKAETTDIPKTETRLATFGRILQAFDLKAEQVWIIVDGKLAEREGVLL